MSEMQKTLTFFKTNFFQRTNWSLNTLKNFYVDDGDLNLHVPLGTSKRLQDLLTNLLVVDQKKRMSVDDFLTNPFFEVEKIFETKFFSPI